MLYNTRIIKFIIGLLVASIVNANPDGGQIIAGQATINVVDHSLTRIEQTSSKAIINWDSFNIAPQQHVHFQQPTDGVALNRINGTQGPAQIFGKLTANGSIVLVNPAGIIFGKSATVDVANLIAATSDITDHSFLSGKCIFDHVGDKSAKIINYGKITAAEHGIVALLGSNVVDGGSIQAKLGKIILSTGSKFTLDFYGDQLINFAIDERVPGAVEDILNNVINMDDFVLADQIQEHNGKIIISGSIDGAKEINVLGDDILIQRTAVLDASSDTTGGQILIGGGLKGSNPQIKNAVNTVIEHGATIKADATQNGNGGEVVVWSDNTTSFYGSISAKGGDLSGNGGFVEVSGHEKLIFEGIVDTTAVNGKIGNLLLDPKFLVIDTSGSLYLAGSNNQFSNNSAGTTTLSPAGINTAAILANITLQANSDVIFDSALNIGTANRTLTINAGRSVLINAAVSTNNGVITITANDTNAVSANRSTVSTGNPAGDNETTLGNIIMAGGTSLDSGTAALNMSINPSVSAPFAPGDMTLTALTGSAISLTTPNAVNGSGNIAASTSLAVNVGTASAISGTISGGTVTKQGIGTLSLSGANSYVGLTTVSAGTLSIANNSGLGTTANGVTVTSGATLDLNGVNIGAESVTINGTGDGSVGALTGTGTSSLSGAVTLGSDSSIGGTGTLTLNGIVSDGASAFNLTKVGAGTLVMAATNTYDGNTTINAGILQIANDVGLGNAPGAATAGKLAFGGGTLKTTSNFTLNSNRGIAVNTGGGTISVDPSTVLTYNGIVAGGANTFAKDGAGTLIIGGVNTYSGATNVLAGILSLTNIDSLGNSSSTTVTSGGVLDFNFNSNTLSNTNTINLNGDGISSGGALTLSGSSIAVNNPISLVTNSKIGGAGSGSMVLGGAITGPANLIISLPSAAISMPVITLASGGTLAVTSGGAITQTGIATIPGTSSFTASGNPITLTQSNNFTGAVTLSNSGSNNISITNNIGLIFAASSVGQDLTTVVNGSITQTGSITVPGISSFTAGANPITLTQSNNFTGAVSLSNSGSNNTSITNSSGLVLGTSTIGQNFNITAGGTITQTGITTATGGTTTVAVSAAGSDILLSQANDLGTSAPAFGGTLSNIRDVNIRNTNAAASTPSFIGLTNLRDLTLTHNNAAIAFPVVTLTSTGNLVATSGGGITQTGVITVPGTSSFTAGANPITLTQSNNFTGAVSLNNSGSNNTSITNNIGLIFAASSVGQNLTTVANGSITQTGAITVPGTSSFTAGANPITLTQSNNFTGAVSLSNSGSNNTSITNSSGLVLGTSTIGQNFNIISGGSVSQTGATTATGGTTTVSVTAAGSDIVLSQANDLGISAPAFGGTLSNIRDVNIRNINAAAAVPSFTGLTNLRNLTLTHNNSAIAFPAVTLTSSGNLAATAGGAITQSGVLTVPGTSSFTAGSSAITLTQNNNFTGAVSLSNSGTNNTSITNNIGLIFAASSVGQDLTTVVNGSITQTGSITVPGISSFTAGANPITLTQSNNFTGAVSLSNSGANDASVTNSSGLVLGASTIGQNFNITAGGTITQIGITTATGGTTTVAVSAASSDILLSQANDLGTSAPAFGGTLSNIRDVNIRNTNAAASTPSFIGLTNLRNLTLTHNNAAIAFPVVTLTSTGNLVATSGGGITQTGVITVPGTSSFTAGANPITLTQSNNFTGAVALSNSGANNVSITNNIDLILAASIMGQNLSVVANGAITQTGILTIPGTSSFTAGANAITLTQSNNFTGAISLSNSGANNASITNSSGLILGSNNIGQNFNLIAGGSVTQTVALTVAGGTTTVAVTAAGSDIVLSQANDLGTSAPAFGGTLSNIRDVNIRNINAAAAVPSFTGLTNLRNLTLTHNSAAIAFPEITLTSSGNLAATAGGPITQSGVLTVPGTSSFTAGSSAITLTQNNNFTGAVSLSNSGTNNTSVTNNTALVLAASSLGQNLTAVANGAITQTGILTIPGTSSFTAGANAITLTQSNNFTGAVSLSNSGSNNTSITNSSGLVLGASTIGQNFNIISGGSVSQTGATTATGGTTTVSVTAAGSDIVLSQANDLGISAPAFGGTLSNIRDVNIRNINAAAAVPSFTGLTNLRNLTLTHNSAAIAFPEITLTSSGNLAATAGGPITQSGVLTVPGTSSFTAGSSAITLTQNNNFTGAVSLSNSGTNNISITNNIGLIFAASSVGQDLTTVVNGSITQTGSITVPGISSFTAGANPITLTQNNNFTGAVSLSNSGSNNTSITNSSGLVLGASTIGQNFNITAGGTITQTGITTATGGTTTVAVSAASSDILLSQANDLGTSAPAFGGTLSNIRDVNIRNINAAAAVPSFTGLTNLRNLTLTHNNSEIAFPAVTLTSSGNLAATAGGAITQSGILTVPGTSSFAAGANPITLTQSNNFTGAVSLSNSGSNNASITNNIGLIFAASSVGQNLTTVANGSITQTGSITVPGISSFTAGANPITLTQSNNFTGAVSLSNSGANNTSITNSSGLVLGASTIGQNFNITAGGTITQTGITTATGGTTTVAVSAAGSDILLSQANDLGTSAPAFGGTLSNIRDVNIRNTNAAASTPSFIGLTNLRDLTLTHNNAAIAFPVVTLTSTGNLVATSGGGITQTGAITVPGTSSFTAGANPITLTQSNNFTGAVSLSNSGTNNTSITNNTALVLAASSLGQNLTAVANGAITQTGILTIPGTSSFTAGANAITLTQSNNFTGAVSLSNSGSNNTSITNSSGLVLGTSTIGQNFNIISGGSVSQTGATTATGGTTTVSVTAAGSDIVLSQANDLGISAPAFGGTLSNIRDVNIRNINAAAAVPSFTGLTNLRNLTLTHNNSAIAFPAVTLTSSGNLAATAGGAITQSGVLTVPGTSSFTAGSSAITLTQSNNFTGAVSLSNSGANNASITNSSGLVLGASTIGQNFNITAGGTITQTGITTATGGTTTVAVSAAGSDILLSQANDLGTSAPAFGGTLSNIRDVNIRNTNAAASTPSFIGLTNLRNLTLTHNNAAIAFPIVTLTSTGNLVATSGGGITQTGAITVPGTSSFTAGANPITLTQSNNFTGAVSLSNSGSNNTSITNNIGLIFVASSVGQNLTTVANGSITQTGSITVPGISSFTAGANPITLTQSNNFTGAVSLSNSGSNNASITNSSGSVLGASTIGQNFNIISGGSVSQTGATTATGGTTTVSVTTAGTDVNLSQANNFGTFAPVFSGTLSNIRDVNICNENAAAGTPNFTGLTNLRNLTLTYNNADMIFSEINASGAITLIGNNAEGSVSVQALTLNTNLVDLTGFVDGDAGASAIGQIVLLNTITYGTHFFDGIDMAGVRPGSSLSQSYIDTVIIPTTTAMLYFPAIYADAMYHENVYKSKPYTTH